MQDLSSDSAKLGYHLENRILFYLARMVSSQKQNEFFHSDYVISLHLGFGSGVFCSG